MSYLAMFPSWMPLIDLIPDNRVKAFLRALLKYAQDGTVTQFQAETDRAVFESIRINIDESVARFNHRCEMVRRNGRKGGLAKSLNRKMRLQDEKNAVLAGESD